MNCEQARLLIQPCADGELDAARIVDLEQHLSTCPACAQIRRHLQGLRKAVRHSALHYSAPPSLKRDILRELNSSARSNASAAPYERQRNWNWNWLAAVSSALSFACVLIFAVMTFHWSFRSTGSIGLTEEIIAGHIRSLQADHVVDVASSDQHTVKPWFKGRLPFSPSVPDLAPQGFPLRGGRLDYLNGQNVAALIYQRHQHTINLYIIPTTNEDSQSATLEHSTNNRGFHIVTWSRAGFAYWAISDISETELREFGEMWRTAASSP